MNYIEEKILDMANEYKENMALYNNIYRSGLYLSFSDIPMLRKQNLIEDQSKYSPFGSYLNVSSNDLVRIHRTSGTQNRPLLLALTSNDVINIKKMGKKAFINAGLTSSDIIVNCMNYCMWMGGFMDHQSLEETGAAVIPYGVGHTENLIELLCSIPNVCIHSTPSYLSKIERVAAEKFGLKPNEIGIKKGFFGGEGGLQNRDFRNKLEEKWNMDIHDANYGMSEIMSIIASEDLKKNGLKYIAGETVYPELFLKDIGTVSNANITEGAIGELVLTNLIKEAQPLIRYRTGDIIEVLEVYREENVCIEFKFRVIGRSDDMIVVKGINFYPMALQSIVSKYSECTGNYKIIIQNKTIVDDICLMLEVKNKDIDDEVLQKIKKEIKSKYFVSCDIEITDNLPVSGNKARLVERIG